MTVTLYRPATTGPGYRTLYTSTNMVPGSRELRLLLQESMAKGHSVRLTDANGALVFLGPREIKSLLARG